MSSPALVEHYCHDGKVWCHTSFIDFRGSLTWKLTGFDVDSYEPGEFVVSPLFSIVGEEENMWYLRLYPSGKTAEGKDFVAAYLHSKSKRKLTEPVSCVMYVVDASGDLCCIKKFTYHPDCSSGLQTFISKSDFIDHKDLLLPDNALTMRCHLTTIRQFEKVWISGPKRSRSAEFNFPRTENTLSRDIGEQYRLGTGCDVVLKVGEAKVPAHKAVLAARSSHFADMFKLLNSSKMELKKFILQSDDEKTESDETQVESDETQARSAEAQAESAETLSKPDETQAKSAETEIESAETRTKATEIQTELVETQDESSEAEVEVEKDSLLENRNVVTVVIKDVAKEVLIMMLDFIYTNECHLENVQSTMELLTAADKYCISQLPTLCSNYLNDNLSENNVLDIVQVADSVADSKLRKTCVEFICRKLSNLISIDSDWKNKVHPRVISDILLQVTEKEKRVGNFAVLSTSQSICRSEPKATSGNSHFTMRKGHLVWKLSDFQICPLEKGRCIYSPQFGISGERVKYHLEFYLKGTPEDDDDGCLSLSLHSSPQVDVSVKFSICIKNARGAVIEHLDDLINFYKSKSYRWNKCVSMEKLDSCLSNDDLLVLCVVGVSKSSEIESLTHTAPLESNLDSRAEEFGHLFESKELADVILEVEENALESEGVEFPKFKIAAHKTILRSRSSVLANMLEASESENSLSLPCWEEGAFRQLLAFLYTDKCSFKNVSNALHIWIAAHKYDVPLLQVECYKYLCEHISDDSVLPIVVAASIVNDENMYKNCIDYIDQEVPSFTFLTSSEQDIRSHPDIYNDILERFASKVNVEENRCTTEAEIEINQKST